MAKKGQIFRKYSAEFKIGVIMDMRDNHLGLRETARKYEVTHAVILKWDRIYLEEGAEGLMKERRGRGCSAGGTRKGRPPKLDKKVEEDLIAENREDLSEDGKKRRTVTVSWHGLRHTYAQRTYENELKVRQKKPVRL